MRKTIASLCAAMALLGVGCEEPERSRPSSDADRAMRNFQQDVNKAGERMEGNADEAVDDVEDKAEDARR